MRTIRTKVYQFKELSKQAQAKAIESFRDTNIMFDWWNQVYDDFKVIAATCGIEVDLNQTFFSGFYSQGDGAGITASVNFWKMMEGVKSKAWESHAPSLQEEVKSFNPQPLEIDPRILKLIDDGKINESVSFQCAGRSFYTKSNLDWDFNGKYREYKRIETVLGEVETWCEKTATQFTNLLYRMLENTNDYLQSDDAVKESLEANEYEFTQDGKQFNS